LLGQLTDRTADVVTYSFNANTHFSQVPIAVILTPFDNFFTVCLGPTLLIATDGHDKAMRCISNTNSNEEYYVSIAPLEGNYKN
jgi:hypothetical protein